MCFFYSITKENSERLAAKKLIGSQQLSLIENVYFANGFAHPKMPVLIRGNSEDSMKFFSWGLRPSFCKNDEEADGFADKTLNVRSESLFEKKAFQESVRQRRCLVLCSGFYEFYEGTGKKYPFFISFKNNDLFVIAGIYDFRTNLINGEVSRSFSIITREADDLTGSIHKKKRMPAILNFNEAEKYLHSGTTENEIRKIIDTHLPHGSMKAHTIARFNPRSVSENNTKAIQLFNSYPEMTTYLKLDKGFSERIKEDIKC